MKSPVISALIILMGLFTAQSRLQAQVPVGTAFTYQGQLKDGGVPVDGEYDFLFRLFDAPNGGSPVGGNIQPVTLSVINGLFTVELDFGPQAFDGEARWLEVGVRPAGTGGDHTILAPRQPLTAAPYALYALDGTTGAGGYWAADGDNIYNTNAGRVGIGTDAPGCPLHLHGTAQIMEKITTSHPFGAWLDIESTSSGGKRWGLASTGSANGEGAGHLLLRNITDDRTVMMLKDAGYVGVGTTAPDAHLDVSKPADSAAENVLQLTTYTSLEPLTYSRLAFKGASIDSYASILAAPLRLNSDSDFNVLLANGGGNVGVGTDVPDVRLHIAGGSDAEPSSGGYVVAGPVSSLNLAFDDNEIMARNDGAPATLYLNNSGGSVTVGGLSTATHSLNVIGVGQSAGNAPLQVHNYQTEAGIAARVTNASNYATMHVENSGSGEVMWLQRADTTGPFIVAYNEQTASRPFQVDANGRTTVTILQITGGADLSEQFRVSSARQEPVPGQVVSIDAERPGDLVVSSRAYDRAVAGVISGAGGVNPGMLMGQASSIADGEHPVALTGRVWCRCETSSGPIRPGDLLTTSDVPGCAMTVTDYDRAHGATIGKAMTGLEEGEGLVLVLVSLQ